MAPFEIASAPDLIFALVFIALGFGFGFVLESAGFGNSTKLAAQFYFRDLTVLKVMMTSIVVAAVLVAAGTSLGLIDLERLWVNPTFLWPTIVGGLLVGAGFIIGGYCPGTSLVSLSTGKIDGAIFVVGVAIGVFGFGETADGFAAFFNGSAMGSLTLPEALGLPIGFVLIAVVLLAVTAFWGTDKLRQVLHGGGLRPGAKYHRGAAGLLVASAVAVAVMGQPTLEEKWEFLAPELQAKLDDREVHLDPAELLQAMNDDGIALTMVDVRDEADWNRFHLQDAERLSLVELPEHRARWQRVPGNGAIVLVGNDEQRSIEGWKQLMAMGRPNAYILAGGVNGWLSLYGLEESIALAGPEDDTLRFHFPLALGSRLPAADPDPHHAPAREFEAKLKMVKKLAKAGGCG